MKVWGRRREEERTVAGVARAAVAGLPRTELVEEAVRVLLANGQADRVGVWIKAKDAGAGSHGCAAFRGKVAEWSEETIPTEWQRLSAEAFPPELAAGGKTVEQDLENSAERPILGALLEMRRAVWVPVQSGANLLGVLFAGSRRKHARLPRTLLESVAAELALAVELAEERRIAGEQQADMRSARKIIEALGSAAPTDTILANLAESCTETGTNDFGLGAVFAVIRSVQGCAAKQRQGFSNGRRDSGSIEENTETPAQLRTPGEFEEFWWRSGDAEWTRAVESEPLAGIWRRALEAHHEVATEPGASWARGEVGRIVAIPLETGGQSLGVLVAGLRRGTAGVCALERLGLRAALATWALLRRQRDGGERREADLRGALLEACSDAVILLNSRGGIAALNRSARELLSGAEANGPAEEIAAKVSGNFVELFRAREQQRMDGWLERVLGGARGSAETENPPEAELYTGTRVRLRMLPTAGSGVATVRLERVSEPGAALPGGASRGDGAETQLRNVIDWLEEGVLVFDEHNGVRAMNSRFAQIAGLSAEDAAGLSTLNALIARLEGQAAEPESFAANWRELACSEGAAREEIQLLRPVPRVLERAARPVLDAGGRRIGRVEIYRDLTAQQVFQSKLLQTEKLAALGQMVTGVAHELSNPLTTILGYAQRLLLRRDAGQPAEARQIFQEAERAITILRQLLMSARESRPRRGRVALNEVVSRAMELQRFSLAAENVRVELELNPALPFVRGDAGQLQQVLMNLIGNARQAIEQEGKGGTIRLSTKRVDEQRVVLEVADDGPGIPETILARIFDPFFTTKPAGIGTGLGLSIVLGIVREHGGQVRVASPPKGGAVFTLEFPAVSEEGRGLPALPATGPGKSKSRPTREVQAEVPQRGEAQSAPACGRVLVVEDEPTVARLIGDVLEDEGFCVDVLLDGREALQRAASEEYDLVICDMKMPGLDGQHFYKTLARSGNPLRERFLFVTGDVIAPHTQEFLEGNHLPHVAKPFRVEELTEKVRSVLAGAGLREPLPVPATRTSAARK